MTNYTDQQDRQKQYLTGKDEWKGRFMRDEKRIDEIIERIRRVWKKHPNWRLTQLIYNVLGLPGIDLYNIEDDTLNDCLDSFLNK